ncbi:MAG: DUF4838 domain-containing protein [Eubacteriales bacterium]|nr:DUF4838 domain-containing protein [Eubacteriales bacterium]
MITNNKGIVILYEDITEYWLELLKESGLTTLGVHKIAVPGTRSVDALLTELASPHGRELINRIEKAGVTVEYELHAMEWLLPRELFADRPELFRADKNGKRTNDLNCCPSNDNALELISANALRLAKLLDQTSDNYFLWLDDAKDSHCACGGCRGMNNADQALTVVGAILRGLRVHNPRARAAFLSYTDTLQVPSLTPDEGIFLEFAPMNRDHTQPIAAPGNESGRIYTQLLPRLLERFKPEQTHILEYWLDNALYSGYRKPPVKVPFEPAVTEADVAYYTGLGITNIKTFGSFIGEDYFRLHGKPPLGEYGEILARHIGH